MGLYEEVRDACRYHEPTVREVLYSAVQRRSNAFPTRDTVFRERYICGEVIRTLGALLEDDDFPVSYKKTQGELAGVFPHSTHSVIHIEAILVDGAYLQFLDDMGSDHADNILVAPLSEIDTGISTLVASLPEAYRARTSQALTTLWDMKNYRDLKRNPLWAEVDLMRDFGPRELGKRVSLLIDVLASHGVIPHPLQDAA